MDDDQQARGFGLSFSYVLVVALFIAAILDVTLFNGGFLVSLAYREMRPAMTIGVLVVALVLWLTVFRAASRTALPVSTMPIQTVRGRGGAFQPVSALVLLLFAASIASGHSVPKYLHELTAETVQTAEFKTAAAPAPTRRDCRDTLAGNPAYGDVTLCLPPDIAAALETAEASVWVTGSWSELGLLPSGYALTGVATELAADPTPALSGFPDFISDFLENGGGDAPAADPGQVPPRRIGKPKDLSR